MDVETLAEIAEINFAFAKAELSEQSKLCDAGALARAAQHIVDALAALREAKRLNAANESPSRQWRKGEEFSGIR